MNSKMPVARRPETVAKVQGRGMQPEGPGWNVITSSSLVLL
uniref:Uncharacterized protein n=1 Tax=Anguilla anguilla TaxID=7936 RepID=A0A0E9W9T7_ANGAN